MKKIISIVGPTGVGKTEISILLAKQLNAEIINCDSMQVYKYMDIGTAKITEAQKNGVKHHLISILEPNENFSVEQYQTLVRRAINRVHESGKTAILVGGTGFYLKAALYDYVFDKENQVDTSKLEQLSNEVLHEMLVKIDPEDAKKIHQNNRQRLIRSISIYQSSGQTKSQHIEQQKHELIYDVNIIALSLNRESLYKRINERVDIMIEEGLEKEARFIYENFDILGKTASKAIGYQEFYTYFNNETSYEQCIEMIKQNSRRYAKRQYTWFRHQMDVQWIDIDHLDKSELLKQILQHLNIQTVYLAGGCFWGVEAYFRRVKGIITTDVGYGQGDVVNPTYQEVCSQQTNHAEICKVTYDSSVISLEKILEHFLRIIDPTSLNKQGGDIGTQYRTGIYFTDLSQNPLERTQIYLENQQIQRNQKFVIELDVLKNFYLAEDYHQDYLIKNPSGYCHVNLALLKEDET